MNNIDWDSVIENIIHPGVEVTVESTLQKLSTPEYNEIYANWRTANFNLQAIKWTNYYPGRHFDQQLTDTIANNLNVNVHRSWISRIDPGFFAPRHWDVDDNAELYLQKGSPVRYSCFIEKPVHGHIFIIGEKYFYSQPQGTIIKWNNYKDWHSGINAGMTPKYMFHLLAYQ